MWTRTGCVVVVLLSASIPAAGQPVLSEAAALARLSPDSPRVRALRSATDVARAEVLAAGRWPNPRLTIDREAVSGIAETMTTVLQPLPITGRLGLERSAASALATAVQSRTDDEVRRVRADLRLAYADLAASQARERQLALTRDRLQGLAEVLGKRETAGDAAGFDRLRADREVLEIEADRAAAASERVQAQGTLAGFLAGPIDPAAIVVEESVLAARVELPPVQALILRAEGSRGQLTALRQEAESARLLARAADRRRVPEPEVLAGTKRSTAAGGDTGSVISVQAVLPIFGRGGPERAIATARAAQAEAQATALSTSLRAHIVALRAVVVERRTAAQKYRTSTSADQIERIAQVSYDAGERGILELLDAYRVNAAARVRQTLLDTAVRRAEIELEYSSGWELP